MRLDFKLYDPKVVDCSGGFVNIIPDEDSIRLLLKMTENIIASDFIQTIGNFHIDFQGNVGPLIKIKSPHVTDDFGFKGKYYESSGISKEDLQKQTSTQSMEKKNYGLYVEKIESAKKRTQSKLVLIVPAGLFGFKKAIEIINNIFDGNIEKFPPIIPRNLDKVIFLSLNIDICFVRGYLSMEHIAVDSRQNLISIIFNSDGLPVPEEYVDSNAFSFIGESINKIFYDKLPNYSLDYVWVDNELHISKRKLELIDKKNKLNQKAFFLNQWYFPVLEQLIHNDIKSDNIISIYHPIDNFRELWVIVKDIRFKPDINTYGVRFFGLNDIDYTKLKKRDLFYGKHITKK